MVDVLARARPFVDVELLSEKCPWSIFFVTVTCHTFITDRSKQRKPFAVVTLRAHVCRRPGVYDMFEKGEREEKGGGGVDLVSGQFR